MNPKPKFLLTALLPALLAACSIPSRPVTAPATLDLAQVATIAAMTLQSYPSQTPLPSAVPNTTALSLPSQTATITPTYTVPILKFDGNTNCRTGPGTQYEIVTVIQAGQQTEASGVSDKGSYWLVKNPDGGPACWVANDFVSPSGSVQALPTVNAPPTPSPIPPNAPVWASYTYTCGFASGGNDLTMNMAWTDRASDEEGYRILRDGEVVVTLAPDSSTYVDTAFVTTGKTLSYTVEVFNQAGRASSSVISAGCQ